jgi:hypothetical protein
MDNNNTYDKWSLTVGWDNFSTKKFYTALVKHHLHLNPSNGFGNHHVYRNINSFFCLLLQDRLNTRDLLSMKNFLLESNKYVLCMENADETLVHLLFSCDFGQVIWWKIGEEWNMKDKHDITDYR